MTGLSVRGPLWLIGAGNMGGAMLRGWIAAGIDPARITVIDPFVEALPAGVTLLREIPDGDARPDTLVLAVKPQQLAAVRDRFAGRPGPRLLLSILAGVETQTLGAAFGATATVRVMPNLPVSIGEGVSALFSADADAASRDEATALIAPLGEIEWISDEALFDAVTALSGCGPGFLFPLHRCAGGGRRCAGASGGSGRAAGGRDRQGIGPARGRNRTRARRCWPIASQAPAVARAKG